MGGRKAQVTGGEDGGRLGETHNLQDAVVWAQQPYRGRVWGAQHLSCQVTTEGQPPPKRTLRHILSMHTVNGWSSAWLSLLRDKRPPVERGKR